VVEVVREALLIIGELVQRPSDPLASELVANPRREPAEALARLLGVELSGQQVEPLRRGIVPIVAGRRRAAERYGLIPVRNSNKRRWASSVSFQIAIARLTSRLMIGVRLVFIVLLLGRAPAGRARAGGPFWYLLHFAPGT
jgi:hypothetical protein